MKRKTRKTLVWLLLAAAGIAFVWWLWRRRKRTAAAANVHAAPADMQAAAATPTANPPPRNAAPDGQPPMVDAGWHEIEPYVGVAHDLDDDWWMDPDPLDDDDRDDAYDDDAFADGPSWPHAEVAAVTPPQAAPPLPPSDLANSAGGPVTSVTSGETVPTVSSTPPTDVATTSAPVADVLRTGPMERALAVLNLPAGDVPIIAERLDALARRLPADQLVALEARIKRASPGELAVLRQVLAPLAHMDPNAAVTQVTERLGPALLAYLRQKGGAA